MYIRIWLAIAGMSRIWFKLLFEMGYYVGGGDIKMI
jgi:hypothetical protein